MKIRKGFVSNSSSTAFIITNLTDEEKTIVDFVAETPWIIQKYIDTYDIRDDDSISQGHLMVSAEENNIIFSPNEEKICYFGDESGTLIGMVYDYMLRGEDISEANKLLNKLNEEKDPEKAAELSSKWHDSMNKDEDNFTGVDSKSFKVRFHERCR